MFEELRQAFRQAVENFQRELHRDRVPENVDRLLKGMIDELTRAQAQVHDLERHIERTRAEIARERANGETCRRRERLALEIGDEDTARVAAEFAVKHEEHVGVLERKHEALEAELAFQRREVAQMMAKVKEARARRDELAATAGRTGAREALSEADDLFAELDRMAEKVAEDEHRAEAAEAFSELDLEPDLTVDPHAPPPPPPDVDERLAELKRRMGRDD